MAKLLSATIPWYSSTKRQILIVLFICSILSFGIVMVALDDINYDKSHYELRTTAPAPYERKILEDKGKSILVTGGAGFIGMHTAIALKKKGMHVVALDNMNDYYSAELKEDRVALLKAAGVDFLKGDVCDDEIIEQIIKDHKIDRVIHLAAQAGVRFSLESPHSYTRANVDCFVSLLEQYVKAGLQKKPLVYASSSSVYGFNNDAPFTEDISDVDHPASLYAATKRSDELIAHTYNHLYNVSSVGLRFFTVYGPYGRPDMSPMIFANKITKNETLKLSNFGNSIRDFTYVGDIVEGIIAALGFDTDRTDLFNLGCNNPIKLTYFVKLMEKGLKKKATKELVPMESGDVPLTYANVTKADVFLGWKPKIKIEEGMNLFIDWYKSHDASKYMGRRKKEVCVITANFAQDQKAMDGVWNVAEVKKKDPSVAYYFFSNLDLDHSRNGWTNIRLDDLNYRRMITKSRVPKFMAWKYPVIEQNCKTVFYLDGSSRPEIENNFLPFLHDLKTKVLSSEIGFATPFHPTPEQNVKRELNDILLHKKDIQKNIDASYAWFREQDDYHDTIPTFQNTYFMYSVTSQNWHKLMTDCFWKRYSQELDSWRDQPLFSYCVHHNKFTPIEFPSTNIFKTSEMGFGGHQYSEKDNK